MKKKSVPCASHRKSNVWTFYIVFQLDRLGKLKLPCNILQYFLANYSHRLLPSCNPYR